MRRIITIALILALIATPCHALTVFQADYDRDEWVETVVYEGDWLPLRKLSEILPYSVEWDEQTRTVYIYAGRTHTIRPDRYLPEGVKIVDGVTWVTARYLDGILDGRAFRYDGELYFFNGETQRSLLVRGPETFRRNALTALYRLRLALPEDYKLIRECLTGGMEYEAPPEGLLTFAAYVYQAVRRPTAYIVSNSDGADLAELIAHEAYHVYLHRQRRQSESGAREYGRRVKEALLETTSQQEVPNGDQH